MLCGSLQTDTGQMPPNTLALPLDYSAVRARRLYHLHPVGAHPCGRTCAAMTGGYPGTYRGASLQPPAPSAILCPMGTATVSFDTHDFVKRLTSVGMPEDQAEVLAKGQSDLYERLVTKEDLEQKLKALQLTLENDLEKAKAELKLELEKVRAELKNDTDRVQANLETVKVELKHDIEAVRAELKNDIETVRAELEAAKAVLKHDIETVKAELKLELEKVRADLEQKLSKQEAANRQALKELELTLTHNMKEMEHKLTIRLGTFMAAGVTLLAALMKFF